MPLWQLEEATEFLYYVSLYVEPVGYYVGLTGSVLRKGESEKDLDMILYPKSTERPDPQALHEALLKAGLKRRMERKDVHKIWRTLGSDDEKHVEVWNFKGKRVDIFFLS